MSKAEPDNAETVQNRGLSNQMGKAEIIEGSNSKKNVLLCKAEQIVLDDPKYISKTVQVACMLVLRNLKLSTSWKKKELV
ncbi:MAG: hypothetical protein Q9179_001457 [Wetmoreana sp. 5 TL-2023]